MRLFGARSMRRTEGRRLSLFSAAVVRASLVRVRVCVSACASLSFVSPLLALHAPCSISSPSSYQETHQPALSYATRRIGSRVSGIVEAIESVAREPGAPARRRAPAAAVAASCI